MPRSRRLLRFSAIARDGHRFCVEEVPRGRQPQARVWNPKTRRYKRIALAISLRDANNRPDRLAIREALRLGEEAVMSYLKNGVHDTPTIGDVCRFSTADKTAPERHPDSVQQKEWERTFREAEAVLDFELPVTDFDTRFLTLVAESALLRTALERDVDAWALELGDVRAAVRAGDVLAAKASLADTYKRVRTTDAVASGGRNVRVAQAASVWPKLTAELLRGMCTHAAQKDPKRFGPVGGLKMETDLVHRLQNVARSLNIQIQTKKNQARYDRTECQAWLRMLSDPRFDVQALLATVSSLPAAYRVRRSHLRIDGDAIRVGIDTGGKGRVALNWRRLEAQVARCLQAMLLTTYAQYEQAYQTSGTDYGFLTGHEWDGRALVPSPNGRLADIDPRYRLMHMLGVERRAEQMLICRRRDIIVVANDGRVGLDERTRGFKTAALHLFSPTQERALGFAMMFGYLADEEREYQKALSAWQEQPELHPEPDYALFSSGHLVKGRAAVKATTSRSANDRTLSDWNSQVETALGITHEPGRALRGWRRGLADLYRTWTRDRTVLDRLMDHAKGKDAERSSTRELVYLDPKDLIVLGHMTDIVEYARTTFAQTGVSRQPDA